jgi:hypothetical protein
MWALQGSQRIVDGIEESDRSSGPIDLNVFKDYLALLEHPQHLPKLIANDAMSAEKYTTTQI